MVSRSIPQEAYAQAAPGRLTPFPAPVRGLNTRDSVLALGQDEARVLVNWRPDQGCCRVRPGYSPFATISASKPVSRLVAFSYGATNALLAACNGSIYSVASGTPSSLGGGYSSDLWSTDYMNGWLFAVNGTDTPWRFNGSSFTTFGYTGPTLTTLNTVHNVQQRLWFTVKNSGDTWYSDILAITGALSEFQVSQIANGGTCMGVFPWRAYTCFFMSTGQVLVYSGDPTLDITLATKYYAPPLMENGSAVIMGAELIAMTVDGPISMDVIASGNAFNLAALGDWGKVAPSWSADYLTYAVNSGFFGKFLDGLVYFNIPAGTGLQSKQYVFNTRNQAWSNDQNYPIASLEWYQGVLYIGSSFNDGVIYEIGGGLDNGNQIVTQARPGFSYLDSPGNRKVASGIKPNIQTAYALTGQFQVDVDFQTSAFTAPSLSLSGGGATTPWGSPWGSPWSAPIQNTPKLFGCAAEGHALSAVLQTSSSGGDVQWFSTDVMVQGGGAL